MILNEKIKLERSIKLLLKRIIGNKKNNSEVKELARKALDVARFNEQQYLAESKQEEKGLLLNGNTSNGVITKLNERKV